VDKQTDKQTDGLERTTHADRQNTAVQCACRRNQMRRNLLCKSEERWCSARERYANNVSIVMRNDQCRDNAVASAWQLP